jgi:hypothetical protein
MSITFAGVQFNSGNVYPGKCKHVHLCNFDPTRCMGYYPAVKCHLVHLTGPCLMHKRCCHPLPPKSKMDPTAKGTYIPLLATNDAIFPKAAPTALFKNHLTFPDSPLFAHSHQFSYCQNIMFTRTWKFVENSMLHGPRGPDEGVVISNRQTQSKLAMITVTYCKASQSVQGRVAARLQVDLLGLHVPSRRHFFFT